MKTRDDNGYDNGRDELAALARQLPAGIAPRRDLWPGIEAAIAGGENRRRGGWGPGWNKLLAQAAAVVLLVGGSSGITWLVATSTTDVAPPSGATRQLATQPVSTGFADNYELGAEFMDARESLASRLEDELDRLPPQTRSEVRQNIVRIRAAIHEIKLALAEQPDNALLQELLVSMYREELTVMRRVEGLASSSMRRTDI